MSMSKFATYAEYQASVPAIDKTATLDRISAMAAEAAAEAQMKRDAARWNHFLGSVPNPAWFMQQIDAEIAYAASIKEQ